MILNFNEGGDIFHDLCKFEQFLYIFIKTFFCCCRYQSSRVLTANLVSKVLDFLHCFSVDMATSHGATVVKNLCYSAPRKPKTKLPASENERTIPNSNDDYEDLNEKRSSRHEKGIKIHTPKSMRDSLKELQTLDEKDFYKHLLALKKEHKRTLKTVEKMYYSEMQKQRSGFDLDHETRITIEDDSLVKRAAKTTIPDDYNPYDVGYEELLQSDLLPASDLVRDMSVKENQQLKSSQGKANC